MERFPPAPSASPEKKSSIEHAEVLQAIREKGVEGEGGDGFGDSMD